MGLEIKISMEGPQDEAMDMKEDDMKAKAKATALKKLLKSPTVRSDSSIAALVELLTEKD